MQVKRLLLPHFITSFTEQSVIKFFNPQLSVGCAYAFLFLCSLLAATNALSQHKLNNTPA